MWLRGSYGRGMTLEGRTAVVTGAARGIGAAVATRLAAQGMRVAAVGLEPDGLAATAAGCGPGAAWWEVDVTDGSALARVSQEVEARLGPASVLVANAGIAVAATLLDGDPDSYDRVIEVNLLGSVRTVRAFAPQLVRTNGHYLQMSSLSALSPAALMGAYTASKAGVDAFARAVAQELAADGVTVGVAYPSWVDTDMVRGADEASANHRARLPPPLNRTMPVGEAADLLVEGIVRRRASVPVPGWVAAFAAARGLLPPLLAAAARRRGVETPPNDGMPVGPGGAADTAARAALDHLARPRPREAR